MKRAYLLEKSLEEPPPSSCDGEPAPERELEAMMPEELMPEGKLK